MRPSARERGYDSRWAAARVAFLRLRPRCEMCGRAAVHVHHREPHKGNPQLFWNRSLWQPLCAACHNRWAQQTEARGYHSRIGGDGVPQDREHPFNRGAPDKLSETGARPERRQGRGSPSREAGAIKSHGDLGRGPVGSIGTELDPAHKNSGHSPAGAAARPTSQVAVIGAPEAFLSAQNTRKSSHRRQLSEEA
jgi:hypothetical protein